MAKEILYDKEQKKSFREKLNRMFSEIYTAITNIPTKLSQLTNDRNFISDENYVHTDNNYTTIEKNKLSNIDPEAMGTTPNITVGNTTTLAEGSSATVTRREGSSDAEPIFDFGIPKGKDGIDGVNGTNGTDGVDGVDAFVYVAYASDNTGVGFSLTPTDSLKYRAEIHTDTEIVSPQSSDFTGVVWVKYIGDDGTGGEGSGDMLASTYDPNNKQADAFSMDNMVETTTKKIMTADERTKLTGVDTGANKTVINNTLTSTSTTEALSANMGTVLSSQINDIATYTTVTAVSNTYTLNLQSKAIKNFRIAVADSVAKTIAVSNVPTGDCEILIELTYTNAAAITWFSGITWLDGIPTFTEGKVYRILLFTSNGGTAWQGVSVGGW